MKIKRYSSEVYQILDGASVAYLALQLSNGRWAAYDRDEKRIGRQTYDTPKQVLEFVAARQEQGAEE